MDAVKVEALARELGVSKGSFYWHFKNRGELLDELLVYWQQETDWLIIESRTAATASDRLLKVFTLVEENYGDCYADTAVFQWAQRDANVAQCVGLVEGKRIDYLTDLLQECGFPQQEAELRAEVAYLAFKGYKDRRNRDSEFSLT